MIGFFVVFGAFIAALAGIYLLWSKRVERELAEGANIEFDRYTEHEPDFIAGFSREEFATVWKRVKFPRFPKYAIVTLCLFALALPVIFGVLGGIVLIGEKTGVFAEPAELAKYVPLTDAQTAEARAHNQEIALYYAKNFSGFYWFFGLLASWLSIVFIVMRQYHRRRPGDLREEMIRMRERKAGGAA